MNIFYKEHTPSEALRPYIHSFWSISSTGLSQDISEQQRCFPAQHCQWIIRVKGRNCINYHEGRTEDSSANFFTGFNDVAPVWAMYGQSEFFGIRITPEFAVNLFNLPFSEFKNHYLNASDWLGREADELAEQLSESSSTNERIRIAEQFFIRHIQRKQPERNYFSEALHILRNHELPDIGEVCGKVYVGERQLQRTFKSTLGISPGFYAKMVRLYRAYHHALYGKGNFTHIAYSLGYADTAHFSREFKEYFGNSPAHHFTSCHFQPVSLREIMN